VRVNDSLFDTLLLMKDGKTAYLGPIPKLKDYFERGQMPIRDGINIADFVGAFRLPGDWLPCREAVKLTVFAQELHVYAASQWT